MTAPLVSVIMPTHNAAPYVGEAIDSVLGQTYEALELIVVDDGSSDGTAEIVAGYAEREPARVTAVFKETSEGPCRARNDALQRASGAYVGWLDHDDVWLPTKVDEQVRLLEARPEVGLVYGYFEAFDSGTGAVIDWPDGRRDIESDVLGQLMLLGCFIGSCTVMFRRIGLDRRGGRLRDRDFSIGDDYYLWMTLALDWQVARVPRVLARYRRHARNESTRVEQALDFPRWRAALLAEFLAEFPHARTHLSLVTRLIVAGRLLRFAAADARARRHVEARSAARTAQWLITGPVRQRTSGTGPAD